MQETTNLIEQLEHALYAIQLSISTLKGDSDPNQLCLFGPPPHIEIAERKDQLLIVVKKHH
ncbi:hypothetical protein ACO1PK_01120 [Alishewanella sp. d11]|uniref:hypothetical protein n=1 Tax=Alishewanella sp. d11 TaxID=3414030 RepID=UPI003BF79903